MQSYRYRASTCDGVILQKVEEILKGLKEDDLRGFLEDSSILTDSLSRELIKRIGGPRSPMAVTDLPIEGFSRDVALVKLYDLQRIGVLGSELKSNGGGSYVRVFHATPLGRKIAETIRAKNWH
jgi:hypothetical protein